MKRIVSVSIGSSLRDKAVETEILGERFSIKRIGTDGDIPKAIDIIRELDGKIDAFGMGGIDLYLTAVKGRKYVIRDAIPIMEAARISPLVDGTGVKNTLEYRVVNYLAEEKIIDLKHKKVLITCAADRFRLAEAFADNGSEVVIGDLIFALGLPFPINKISSFKRILGFSIPIISRLPFELLYPTGEKQNKTNHTKFSRFYKDADIIAGDFHYIKKYIPENLDGKIIITNTITPEDLDMLNKRGAKMLVTTTPQWDGRSFGTNVIEAVLVSILGKKPENIVEEEYYSMFDRMRIEPRIEYLN